MALQVWIPFNGNTNNQGLSGITLTGSPLSWDTGIGGKSAKWNGDTSNVVHYDGSEFNYTDNFSFCAWINHDYSHASSSTAHFIFTVGRADYGGFGYGFQVTSSNTVRVWFGTSCLATVCPENEWHHIAGIVREHKLYVYVDGILGYSETPTTLPTYSDGKGLGIGCFHHAGGDIYPYYGKLADFRIYDHPLSIKELKDISKGLILHYPMNQPEKCRNIATNAIIASMHNFYSATRTYDSGTKTFTITTTGVSESWGCGIEMGTSAGKIIVPYGKRLCVSFEVYCPEECKFAIDVNNYANSGSNWSGNDNDQYQDARIINKPSTIPANTWTKIWFSYANTSSSNTNKVDLYDGSGFGVIRTASDTSMTYYIKNLKYELQEASVKTGPGSMYTPAWEDFDSNHNVEYDISGFNNHGSLTTQTMPNLYNDSPMYNKCYLFNGTTHCISAPSNFSSDDITVVFWFKRNADTNSRQFLFTVWDGFTCELDESNNLRFAIRTTDGSQIWCNSDQTITVSSGWTQFCGTFKKCTGLKIYVNGALKNTTNLLTPIAWNISNSYIGKYPPVSSTETFNGCLSDIRVYCTALSDSDVKELYNVPISITDNGALITKGEFVEN